MSPVSPPIFADPGPVPLSAERAAVRDRCAAAVAAADGEAKAREKDGDRLSMARLGVFLSLIATAFWAHRTGASPAWTLVPVAVFVLLVRRHRALVAAADRARRRAAWHRRRVDRMEGRWTEAGDDGERFLDGEHPFSGHLDVFGRGSLFHRIDLARTSAGKETLARWLSGPPDPAAAALRQRAVEELRPREDLREDLALLGDDAASAGLEDLGPWAVAPPRLDGAGPRVLAIAGPALSAGLLSWWLAFGGPFLPAALALAASWFVLGRYQERVDGVLRGADASSGELVLLADLLHRFEVEEFRGEALAGAGRRLRGDGVPASMAIASLRRLMVLRDAAYNQVFAPVALVLLWPLAIALRVEAWKRRHGESVGGWIASLGELEALSSLAAYAAENPEDPFPSFERGPPMLDGRGLSHPLLQPERAVRNDLVLDAGRRVLVVSGSNMSGKSTFLRTVGTNIVLAFAGAPVRAVSLRLPPLAVGASVNVHDSLLDGESRFYAEVRRVALVVGMARGGEAPLLFLLDELFHGTNSADRREGARAVVKTLLQGGALGLVTTHDLELARLAEDLDGAVANVHLEDRLEDGRMTFDYRLRPGVVTHSNALALMRAVGLEV